PEYRAFHRLSHRRLRSHHSCHNPPPAATRHNDEYCPLHFERAQLSRPGDLSRVVEDFQTWAANSLHDLLYWGRFAAILQDKIRPPRLHVTTGGSAARIVTNCFFSFLRSSVPYHCRESAASVSRVLCMSGRINQLTAMPKSAPVSRRSSQLLSRRPNIWVNPSRAIGMLNSTRPHHRMPGSRFLVYTKTKPIRNIEL